MQITFRIEYRTRWGEMVGVILNDTQQPLMLTTADGIFWEGTHHLSDTLVSETDKPLLYRYAIYLNGSRVRIESGRLPHAFELAADTNADYVVHDAWRDVPRHNYLFTSAFTAQVPTPSAKPRLKHQARYSVGLRVLCPCLSKRGMVLGVSGSSPALGLWHPEQAIRMREIQPGVWYVALDTALHYLNAEYKFVALDAATGRILDWESGQNRHLYIPSSGHQPDNRGRHWQSQEVEVYFDALVPRLSGTAIPLFALRSEGSQGVGDFGDLNKMVDWAIETHQQVIQILPINDTTISHTWIDSYPYRAISIYAFHPIYIDLRQLPPLRDKASMSQYEQQRAALNALDTFDYEGVYKLKHDYLRSLYKQNAAEVLNSEEFKHFSTHNAEWLKAYAVFSYLRDLYGTADFRLWPEYSRYDIAEVANLYHKRTVSDEIRYYEYLQFILHTQLLSASRYAAQHGVVLKGDIPIGITAESVEAWTQPHYFNLDGLAGAPPDAFSRNGQNWGFPTYKWDIMAKDGYQWWRNRFAKMAEYFSAYRIDHILGFFRIWQIPRHSVHGLLGVFEPALPMSVREIESFGLYFDHDLMVNPYIDDQLLDKTFGDLRQLVVNDFLQPIPGTALYALRPEFDTQRKVQVWFATTGRQMPYSDLLREGLYALISNVLFIPDTKYPDHYHPRIVAQDDYTYSILDGAQQEAFNRLYNHFFYERHNDFWRDSAMKKLPYLLDAAPMLACGEDLGMVPACVADVMARLQILSLEIQRMPKAWGLRFGNLSDYPRLSVCTTGTHDMTTLRGWWQEDSDVTDHYYHEVLGRTGSIPHDATPEICHQVLADHLASPSVMCILPFQDWLSIDPNLRRSDIESERINVPADPRNYWHYRMHLTLEALCQAHELNSHIRNLIDTYRGEMISH